MIIYEVSGTVSREFVPEYEHYMRERHIPDVLATGSFSGAAMARAGENRYRILYECADDATLRQYLDEHAPALRADFAKHFPMGVELSRDVWHVLERWTPDRAAGL